MRLREFAEIRMGNMLLVACQGITKEGEPHCCGTIRIPFDPPLPGCSRAKLDPDHPGYWKRTEGSTVDDITLTPSLDAGECGHFNVTKGEIIRHA